MNKLQKTILLSFLFLSCFFAFTWGNVLNAEEVCGDTITAFCMEDNYNLPNESTYLDYTCGNVTYQTVHIGYAPTTDPGDVVWQTYNISCGTPISAYDLGTGAYWLYNFQSGEPLTQFLYFTITDEVVEDPVSSSTATTTSQTFGDWLLLSMISSFFGVLLTGSLIIRNIW